MIEEFPNQIQPRPKVYELGWMLKIPISLGTIHLGKYGATVWHTEVRNPQP